MNVHGTHNAEVDSRNDDILIYVNGDYYKRNEAKISVFDSGYLVGDGIWEAIRLHHGTLVFLEKHMERLWEAASAVGMDLKISKTKLERLIYTVLEKNKMDNGVHVRCMFTRGIKKTPSQDPRLTISGPNIVIIPEYKTASEESREKGIKLFTSTVRRGSPDYLDPRLNCHSKLHEVQALIQAIEAGADEALMLDINGMVATCNATNFFMIKNGEAWTSTGKYCMNGITRWAAIQVCHQLGIPCLEKDFSLYEVYGADEAFVTGTFGGITPVKNIDGRTIGSGEFGPVSRKIHNGYLSLVQNQIK
ncbi:MAG: aminotransferase class IV [Bacteroidota bacterium]